MTQREVRSFVVAPHDRPGAWESNDRRYRRYAHELLNELEHLSSEVERGWPWDAERSITSPDVHPELWTLARRRDRASDSTRIYAAMAIEGFLNFYGVLRLGQVVFDSYFERLGVIPKLRQLLLVCDQLEVPKNHALCVYADAVALSRNKLVHPKTKEIDGDVQRYPESVIPPQKYSVFSC